jgi:hypothetical protein
MSICKSCGKWLDSHEKAIWHYYLGRPCDCFGEPSEEVSECENYVPNTEQYSYEYGGIQTWKKESDGNIYPSTFGPEGYLYETWFRQGFSAAIKILSDPNFKKECTNCEYSNPHIINKCEKTELCDKYQLDYLKSFDKSFYGHLCKKCTVKDCNKTSTDLVWECDLFNN